MKDAASSSSSVKPFSASSSGVPRENCRNFVFVEYYVEATISDGTFTIFGASKGDT